MSLILNTLSATLYGLPFVAQLESHASGQTVLGMTTASAQPRTITATTQSTSLAALETQYLPQEPEFSM